MTAQDTDISPALAASHASWAAVGAHDREGWLALMAEDVLVEDPVGVAITNPDGAGMRGKEAVGAFYDANIAPNTLTVRPEETFPSSSPLEVAHVLVLHTVFPDGSAVDVRGVFTYRVDEDGLLAAMRGYWTNDSITFLPAP